MVVASVLDFAPTSQPKYSQNPQCTQPGRLSYACEMIASGAGAGCHPSFFAPRSSSTPADLFGIAGVGYGLPADLAARMAVETMGGTAATLAEHDNDTRELRRRVTSPGGMTARGLAALERGRVRAAFEEAVAAVVEGRS